MLFVKKVREYKISSKMIKSAGSKIYTIGFPSSIVENSRLSFEEMAIKIGSTSYESKDGRIVFLLEDEEAKVGYIEWKEKLQLSENKLTVNDPASAYVPKYSSEHIIRLIRNYDLANSTPMQGLNFIQKLKREVCDLDNENRNL